MEALIQFCQQTWLLLLLGALAFIGRYWREVSDG